MMKPQHLKTVRALGYTLTLGDQDAWWGMVPVLMARLTTEERACLAFMALKALDDDTAHMTADAALDQGAGQPQAPLFGFMDQAAFWADMANPDELDAYAVAIFSVMSSGKKRAFLDFAGRAAA